MKVMTLLSLFGDVKFRQRRRDIHFWSLNLSDGISCKSFFHYLLDSSFYRVGFFSSLEGEVLKKV